MLYQGAMLLPTGVSAWMLPQVLEECGYCVSPAAVVPVASYQSAIGFSGSRHSMFFVEVSVG